MRPEGAVLGAKMGAVAGAVVLGAAVTSVGGTTVAEEGAAAAVAAPRASAGTRAAARRGADSIADICCGGARARGVVWLVYENVCASKTFSTSKHKLLGFQHYTARR